MNPFRAFCITLPEYPQRTERAKKHFMERGLTDVTFFNGIHAEKFGLATKFNYEVDNPGSGFNIGFKPTGIWLSHYMLWSALSLLWDELFLILEDDAKLCDDWHSRTIDALKNTPKDFDMLYLGSCCCEKAPKRLIAAQVWEVKYPMCLHGYMVSKKAIPVMLETQRKVYAPIDISLPFHSHPRMKVYTVLPTIMEQFDTVLSP